MSEKPRTISKDDLRKEVARLRSENNKLRSEVVRGQIVSATLRDVVLMLGFMGREPGKALQIAPDVPEVRGVMVNELHSLTKHLRQRADEIDAAADKLLRESSGGESS